MGGEATIIAAMVMRTRKRIVRHFRFHNAVRPAHAVRYQPQRMLERHQFERMLKRGIVREEPGGLYWVNVAVWKAHSARRQRILLAAVVLALIVIFYLLMRH